MIGLDIREGAHLRWHMIQFCVDPEDRAPVSRFPILGVGSAGVLRCSDCGAYDPARNQWEHKPLAPHEVRAEGIA